MVQAIEYFDPPRIVDLDLSKVTIYGRENNKSAQVIESILIGMELGDDIPPVPVDMIDENTYAIDEGHHRTIAHMIAEKPLKCKIYAKRDKIPQGRGFFDMREADIISDPQALTYKRCAEGFYRNVKLDAYTKERYGITDS
jgi:hypothetical protein